VNATAEKLVREAHLYKDAGCKKESVELLNFVQHHYPSEKVKKEILLATKPPGKVEKATDAACTLLDWLYMPAVIGTCVAAAYLISEFLLV
jgi:hypothetical protein